MVRLHWLSPIIFALSLHVKVKRRDSKQSHWLEEKEKPKQQNTWQSR